MYFTIFHNLYHHLLGTLLIWILNSIEYTISPNIPEGNIASYLLYIRILIPCLHPVYCLDLFFAHLHTYTSKKSPSIWTFFLHLFQNHHLLFLSFIYFILFKKREKKNFQPPKTLHIYDYSLIWFISIVIFIVLDNIIW